MQPDPRFSYRLQAELALYWLQYQPTGSGRVLVLYADRDTEREIPNMAAYMSYWQVERVYLNELPAGRSVGQDPQDRQARKRVGEEGVKLQTIHSAKGLQYPAVILLWFGELPGPEQERAESLCYVGLTRAETYLGYKRIEGVGFCP